MLFSWALVTSVILVVFLGMMAFAYLEKLVYQSGLEHGKAVTLSDLYAAASNKECQPVNVPALSSTQPALGLVNISCLQANSLSGSIAK